MDSTQQRQLRFFLTLAGYSLLAVLVIGVAWLVRRIWPPFFVAFVFAVALAPLVDRQEARHWPRPLAIAAVYLGVFGTIGGLLFVLIPLVSDQIAQIVFDLREKFRLDQGADISRTVVRQIELFGRTNNVPGFMVAPLVQQAKNSANLLTSGLEQFGRLLLNNVPNLIWVVLVPIITFYVLIDYHRIFAKILLLVPRHHRDSGRSIASDMAVVFGKYLRGLGLICLLNTAATTLVLYCFPVTRPYAAALGLIAGVLYAVPYLGAIVSTALIALVALAAQDGSVASMVWVTIAMVALHQIFFDQVLAPRVLGGQVGLHPILSIMALMAGDALFGVGGMLLAVPIAASIQVVVVHLMPRLGRRVEVKMQEEPPTPVAAIVADEDHKPAIVVSAGEGVTSEPRVKKAT